MRVFLYEFLTGGGSWSWGCRESPAESLVREGAAMLAALAEDFLRIPGTEVIALRDSRLAWPGPPGCRVEEIPGADEEAAALDRLARHADWTLLIAPEIGGSLLDRCRRVESAGGRLLSPGSALVRLAADKHRTAVHAAAAGVPVAVGVFVEPDQTSLPELFSYPAVLKPCDGAGSQGVRLVRDAAEPARSAGDHVPKRLERWYPGTAASVAVLGGPHGFRLLEPCGQQLSDDGQFRYLGGWTPLSSELARRATRLARQVAACLPSAIGFWGMDLVLGPDGSESDVLIEVNPRLTTSYLGLRLLARQNLAAAMLAIAEGRDAELSFGSQRVDFAPNLMPTPCRPIRCSP